jgi:drug/metabolite transporter (DMT)-like permease
VALVGAYLVSFGTLDPIWNLGSDQLTAAGLAVGAAALWGAGTVFGRYMLADVEFSTLAAARFFFAVPFLFGVALWQSDVSATFTGLADHPGRLFLVALIPGLLSMLVFYQGLRRTRASYATLAELAFPATALILNWIFLDATISGTQAFGFLLLWGSIAALSWIPTLRRSPVQPATEVTASTS